MVTEAKDRGTGDIRFVDDVNPIDNVATYEIFRGLPIKAAFSWGRAPVKDGAENFSISHRFPDPDINSERTNEFLRKTGMPALENYIGIVPRYPIDSSIPQIKQVGLESIDELMGDNGFSETPANFVWTKDPEVSLGVKPADCVVFTAHGRNRDGDSVLGLGHMSYHMVDMNLAFDAIQALIQDGVDPQTLKVAIGPSIAMDNYSFPMKDRGLIQHDEFWHGGLQEREDRLHLDLEKATVGQLVAAGILPANIEVVRQDTFKAAANREGLSDRYAKSMREVDPTYEDGRLLFAAALEKDPVIIDSDLSYEEAIGIARQGDLIPPEEVLRGQDLIDVEYYSFDGKIHKGQMIVNKALAQDVIHAFELMKGLRFPISTVIPAAHKQFRFDDEEMMIANNSSGFNYRNIAGTERLSNHSFGRAIDLNPRQNPYIRPDYHYPPDAVYDPSAPGTFTQDHPVVLFFKTRGWTWGGDWIDRKDYMHFEKPNV